MKWVDEMRFVQGIVYFYWDIFFLLNFIMNLFLIGMTGLLRRKYIVKKRFVLAAFLGSLGMTAGMIVQLFLSRKQMEELEHPSIFLFFMAIIMGIAMLQITFREKQILELLADFWGMIQVSIVTGGCLLLGREHISTMENISAKFLLTGAFVVYLLFFVALHYFGKQEQQKHVLDGILSDENGKEYTLRVLYDTGNQLVSPYTGEPVMVISKELIEQLEVSEKQLPLWIPYHSIGGDGLLPAYRFHKLTLQNGEIREHFLAAASEEISADRTIQIIWNG